MIPLFEDKLKVIANDSLLLQVLKAVFDEEAEKLKPVINSDSPDNTNELLGEKYRAYLKAKEIIDKSFAEIINHKEVNKPEIKFNKER